MKKKQVTFYQLFSCFVNIIKKYIDDKILVFSYIDNKFMFVKSNYGVCKYFTIFVNLLNDGFGLFWRDLNKSFIIDIESLESYINNKSDINIDIVNDGIRLFTTLDDPFYIIKYINNVINNEYNMFVDKLKHIKDYECDEKFIKEIYSIKSSFVLCFGKDMYINNNDCNEDVKLILSSKCLNYNTKDAQHIFSLYHLHDNIYVLQQNTNYFEKKIYVCTVTKYFMFFNF